MYLDCPAEHKENCTGSKNMIDSIFPLEIFFSRNLLTLHSRGRKKHDVIHHQFSLCFGLSNAFSLIVKFSLLSSHNSAIRAYQNTVTFEKASVAQSITHYHINFETLACAYCKQTFSLGATGVEVDCIYGTKDSCSSSR